MKDHRPNGWRAVFFAFAIAYFWFFPPDLFRDCIHVVLPPAAPDHTQTDTASGGMPDRAQMEAAPGCPQTEITSGGTPNRALTEEDYLDLFHIENSEYKIVWKFFQND